jgi:hypothetical protein
MEIRDARSTANIIMLTTKIINLDEELDHMTETLDKLVSNREDNGKVLERSETSMIQQISVMKSKLLKHIDELEFYFLFFIFQRRRQT